MFALRRSSLRLATSVPFLRPPRILAAAFSDLPPPPPNPFVTPSTPSTSSTTTPAPPGADSDWGDMINDLSSAPSDNLIQEVGAEMMDEIPISSPSALPHDRNPFSDSPVAPHRFHCFSSRTNTRNTFTDADGNVLAWFSGGSCGFKKRNRSSYEAGYQCAVRLFEKIAAQAAAGPDANSLRIDLFFKGFGQGRDALLKALMTAQGDEVRNRIVSITDRSPLKIGGTRARKMKRR